MTWLSDEILNKYIDEDLSPSEMSEVREVLKNSEEDRRNFKALQLVHQSLKSASIYKTSSNFTSQVMAGLKSRVKAKKEDKFFIFSISSVFVVISLGIIIFILYNIIEAIHKTPQAQNSVNTYVNYIVTFLQNIGSAFNTGNISIFGSVISLGIIISAYLFYENLRNTKRRLSRQH